ncbi:MAG: zf-HC2 domain-containing protein [Tissierellia bacterium]|nr:zf-HC2 domain-containing protein [Tissierellia bacterium]NLY86226.1 zf-HC2 domain-containing protein [Tissierellia bacterium]
MKISCKVIEDILPLYVEEMVSEDTKKLVDEHIDSCESCRRKLNGMSLPVNLPLDTDTTAFKRVKAKMRKKKIQTVIFAIMMTISIIVALISTLTAREYIPYHEGLISFIESDDGTIIIKFSDQVAGYNISTSPSKIGEGYTYHITTWDSIWYRNIMKKSNKAAFLNLDGKKVDSVYYYNADRSEDILIYGKDQNPTGGMVTLPRLVLGYYLLLALFLASSSGILLYLYRKNERAKNILLKFFLLPISYITAHLLIKGFPVSSYSAMMDFVSILINAISLYIATISAMVIIRE